MSSSPASSLSSWSPSSSARSSPVHAASLVDPALHSPALMRLIDIELSDALIDYMLETVVDTVTYAMDSRAVSFAKHLSAFRSFALDVLTRSETTVPTLLVALTYIQRARPHLSVALAEWALERVFLGALIAASKYTNDSTLRNVHWALCTGVFGRRDVGRIEREFLEVLDWELGVKERDLLVHWEVLRAGVMRMDMEEVFVHPVLKSAASSTETLAELEPEAELAHSPTGIPLPELEPSSPASSFGSLSPPTPFHPLSPVAVPAAVPTKDEEQHPIDVPMDVDQDELPHAKQHAGHECRGRTRLRTFIRHLPLPRHHHRIHHIA
uniref:Cyclin N-terminal domain-containing protein n=1 Tax=Mycena chlorophos TaxID=658473 RepID=A0ABQ0L1U3_MYCCL|nr:predicted protein [Mycena chlorophos]